MRRCWAAAAFRQLFAPAFLAGVGPTCSPAPPVYQVYTWYTSGRCVHGVHLVHRAPMCTRCTPRTPPPPPDPPADRWSHGANVGQALTSREVPEMLALLLVAGVAAVHRPPSSM